MSSAVEIEKGIWDREDLCEVEDVDIIFQWYLEI